MQTINLKKIIKRSELLSLAEFLQGNIIDKEIFFIYRYKEINMKLFASLGFDCYVTWTIRRCGFQQTGSLPLDWINSYEFEGIGKFFVLAYQQNFEKFHDLPLSSFDPPSPEILYYPELKLRFPHEFNENLNINRENFIEKYKRRFHRLRELSQQAEHTYFIRQIAPSAHNQKAETESQYLKNIPIVTENIANFLGHRNFTILLMSQENFFSSKVDQYEHIITINNIKSFTGGYLEAEAEKNWNHEFFQKYTKFFTKVVNLKPTNNSVNILYQEIFS